MLRTVLSSPLLAGIAAGAWNRLPVAVRRLVMRHYPRGRFRVGVLAMVLNDRSEVLLLRHHFRAGKPWGLPGGWLEPWESPEEGMRRELEEELGIDVAAPDLELVTAVGRPGQPHVEIFYRVRASVDPPANVEFDEYGYFAVDDLPDGMLDLHRETIRLAND